MPALQSLVLTDRATTPVNHTFNPEDIRAGVAYVSETGSTLVGSSRVSISMRTSGDKKKGRLVLSIPVVQTQTINGVSTPVVVRTAVADLSVTFSTASTEQERTDLIGMLASALATSKVLVHDTFVKGQGIYGA